MMGQLMAELYAYIGLYNKNTIVKFRDSRAIGRGAALEKDNKTLSCNFNCLYLYLWLNREVQTTYGKICKQVHYYYQFM